MESSRSRRTSQMDDESHELNAMELGKAYFSVKKHQKVLSMGAGKPIPPYLPDSNQYTVEFDGPGDPAHPLNWDFTVKLVFPKNAGSVQGALLTLVSHRIYISSMFSLEPSRHLLPVQFLPQVLPVRARPSGLVQRWAYLVQHFMPWDSRRGH